MIIDDIVNELDRFITKYKGLKTDNQNLTQFKTDVKTALNSKGIISTTEDSEVVNSINSYNPPSGASSNYRSLIYDLSNHNIFRQKNADEMEAVGKVKDTFEVVSENNVKIYSLYDIQNVKIAEGQYKSRVEQTPFSASVSLSVDYSAECGNVTYNTLALFVQPKEADNINGEVVIKYTTNGQEHSVTMPIKDLKKRSLNGNFYILKQNMFRLNEYSGDTIYHLQVLKHLHIDRLISQLFLCRKSS